MASNRQLISEWKIEVYDDGVYFTRVDGGKMQEGYPLIDKQRAAVYATAIVNGLQPPRCLIPHDKPIE